jgi:hypothetical protein
MIAYFHTKLTINKICYSDLTYYLFNLTLSQLDGYTKLKIEKDFSLIQNKDGLDIGLSKAYNDQTV